MINIVVPMAGAGTRFSKAGYSLPKPFIDVAGTTMIERVLANLRIDDARFILLARNEHLQTQKKDIERIMSTYNTELLTVDALTEGAACTVLLAARLINTEEPLMIANSDQLVDMNIADYVHDNDKRGLDGSILTFWSDDPKWSYAATDEQGFVTRVVEKEVISSQATVGIYYWRRGADFVTAAAEMIAHNERVNNEFYVAPAYNYAIANGAKIGIYEIKEAQMHGLGTPEDLKVFLTQNQAKEEKVRSGRENIQT